MMKGNGKEFFSLKKKVKVTSKFWQEVVKSVVLRTGLILLREKVI